MLSTLLEVCTVISAAALTVGALNVAIAEWLARADDRPLPKHSEWSAMCQRIHYHVLGPGAVSALAALAASAHLADDRWQVGAALMIGATCYAWYMIVPVGFVLHTIDPSCARTMHLTKARFNAFARKHYPLACLGVGALAAFAWAHA
jgi:hypothetical protein